MVGEGHPAWLSHLDSAKPEQINLLSTGQPFVCSNRVRVGKWILQEEGKFLDLRTPVWVNPMFKKYSILFSLKLLTKQLVCCF